MKLSTNFIKNRVLFFLGFILVLPLLASTALASSPDGSTITSSSGSSLSTSAGTWTFSSATGGGGKMILLNGKSAEGGSGVKLLIANNGHMYTENSQSTWWLWSGTAWSTTTSPLAVSANNSTIVDGSGKDLATSAGLWTFSTATGAGGYMILLNGVSAGGGSGVKLEIANGGQMYAMSSSGAWYLWSASTWKGTSAPSSTKTCGGRPPGSGSGFYVSKGLICDANGNEFRLRGMDKAHYDEDQHGALIAAHANVVRLFMYNIENPSTSDGNGYTASDYGSDIINEFAANYEVVILTAASVPGGGGTSGDASITDLNSVVNWWVSNVNAFKTPVNGKVPMNYMMINIANEWGAQYSTSTYETAYQSAVVALRKAGYTCPLVVDADVSGEGYTDLLLYSGGIFNADPQKNTIFSLHEYYVTNPANGGSPMALDAKLVDPATSTGAAAGAAFIIGEFGPGRGFDGQQATPNQVIAAAEANNIGWVYWAMDDHNGNDETDDNTFDACYNDSDCNSATLSSPSTISSLNSTLYTLGGQEVILGCTNASTGGCGCSLNPAVPNSGTASSPIYHAPGCSGGTFKPTYSGQGMINLAKPATIFP